MSDGKDMVAAVDRSSGKIQPRVFWELLLVNLTLLCLGVGTTIPPFRDALRLGVAGMALALVAIGLYTYLRLFVDSGDIRSALTASMMFVYLAMLGMSFHEDFANKLASGFGTTMFNNFTTLVSVVVGFYFGGKAVEKAFGKEEGAKDTSQQTQLASGAAPKMAS